MKRTILAMVVGILLLAGCGDPPPKEGFVREKKYEPAHWEGGYRTEYRPEYRCHYVTHYDSTRGSYGSEECGIENVSYQEYDDHYDWIEDRWRLKIEDCKPNDKGEQKCRDGWVTVDHDTYDDFAIGHHYPDNTPR